MMEEVSLGAGFEASKDSLSQYAFCFLPVDTNVNSQLFLPLPCSTFMAWIPLKPSA